MIVSSKYNILKKSENNEVTVLNTVSGKKIILPINSIILEKIKSRSAFSYSAFDEDIKKLYLDGFFVDSNEDEFEKLEKLYNQAINNPVLELTIIVTDGCNFKCLYCYQEDREYKTISFDILENILKYIETKGNLYKVIRINWFGGEPMLGLKKIIAFMEKCIEICKKIKVQLISGMTTNGYLLTPDTMRKLLECKVCLFQITLDGNKNVHNKLRPHKSKTNSYEKIIENLTEISLSIKKYFEIIIRINLTKDIIENLNEFMNDLKFMKMNNKFSLNCQKMANYGGNSIKFLMNKIIDDNEFKFVYKLLIKNGFNLKQQPSVQLGSGLCSSCKKNSYYLDQYGNILKCSLAIYNPKVKEKNIVGYLNNNGEMIISNQLENYWIKRNEPDDECKECKFYPICYNHYCPYRRIMKNSKICYGYKKVILESL